MFLMVRGARYSGWKHGPLTQMLHGLGQIVLALCLNLFIFKVEIILVPTLQNYNSKEMN